jgi:hypothetical protein
MKRRILSDASMLLLLVAVVAACSNIQKSVEQATPPKTITSKDGKAQLSVPSTWREDVTLNPVASLQAANTIGEMYVAVITEGKEDFSKDMTLDKFASLAQQQQGQRIESANFTTPVRTTINGYPAVQYEVNGTIQNVNLAYLNTIVETPNNFHQILTWTLKSKFDANKPTLQQVAQSFKEVQGGAPSSGTK